MAKIDTTPQFAVVATGSPWDGLTLTGPFLSVEHAVAWGEQHGEDGWDAVPLIVVQSDYQGSADPEEMRLMLTACRNQFRYYANNHRAKGTIDSIKKGRVNDQFADRIEIVLAGGAAVQA